MEPRWHIQLMGELAVHGDGATIRSFRTQKTAALLAYLAYFSQSHSREVLIDRFWPESDLQRGRQSLSTALSALRAQLEPYPVSAGTVIQADRASVRLNPDAVTTDVRQFEAALRAVQQADDTVPHYEAALNLYGGTLLPGHYDNWITSADQYLVTRYISGVLTVVDHLIAVGKAGLALRHLQRAADYRPYDEDITAQIMNVLATTGRVSEAATVFEDFQKRMRSELDTSPDERLFTLYDDLRAQIPTPSFSTIPALPLPPNPLIGREDLLRLTTDKLTHPNMRLVTLMGPGGIGKTRLALAAAHALQDAFAGRVWYVPLSDIAPDVLPIEASIRERMGAEVLPGVAPIDLIRRALGEQPTLLVLDNTEHILEAAADVCTQLLRTVPTLTVLVTSRQRLNLTAEHVVPVGPLPLPSERTCTPDKLRDVPSVQMFVARARAAAPDFASTETNAGDIARLMRGLEGIPLAIELAASRAGLLSPAQMVRALDDRLGFLSDGSRDSAPRHRTLRACIAWSYDLLPPDLQRALCQLAVFQNGWTFDGASALLDADDPLAALAHLQAAALIQARLVQYGETDERRFFMLASVRDFAREQVQSDDLHTLQARHAAYIADVTEQANAHLRARERDAWLARLEHEHDDFAFAAYWTIDHDRLDLEARIVGALHTYWLVEGYWEIAAQHHRALLARLAAHPGALAQQDDIRQRAHCQCGYALLHLGEFAAAAEQFRAVLAAETSRLCWLAQAQRGIGLVAMKQGETNEARAALEVAQALAANLEDDHEYRVIAKHLATLRNGASGTDGG